MAQERPNIFSFHDYREFLRELFAFRKREKRGFNVAKLAVLSNMTKSHLSMVLAGKRKLTDNALDKMIPHLDLNENEQKLLRLLCALGNASTQTEKARLTEQLHNIKAYQRTNPKEAEVYRYLTRWYYAAIREMAALADFKLDAIWIQQKLGKLVPLAEIEKAVEFLVEHKFLIVDKNGKTIPPEKRLDCLDQVFKTAMIEYHRQIFETAIESVPGIDRQFKVLNGTTISVSYDSFTKIKARLEEALKDVLKISSEDENAQAVFQVSLLGFPLTKPNVAGDGK